MNVSLRSGIHLASRNMTTTLFGTETVSNVGAKIWPLLPDQLKSALSLEVFKSKVKKWFQKFIYSKSFESFC